VLSSAQSISSSNTAIGSYQLVGSTYTSNGFSSSSSSSVNIPLVLGITIPVCVVFIVVVVVIVIKLRRGNKVLDKEVVKVEVISPINSPAEHMEAPIQFDHINEEHNDTANTLRKDSKKELKSTRN